jgi:tRNA threonylcarbamoyladenosine biosynthesis protein TsaB
LITLGLDTSLEACSAAIVADGRVLARRSEAMARGHQERLAPLVEALAGEARVAFTDLDRVGVTVGPGSFTGLRVGLAFAKGLALALDIPCVGIGSLEALALSAGGHGGVTAAAIDARREQIYLQVFDGGGPLCEARALNMPDALSLIARCASGRAVRLVGSAAPVLAPLVAGSAAVALIAPDPVVITRYAAEARAPFARPGPLYLRAPDARLPA